MRGRRKKKCRRVTAKSGWKLNVMHCTAAFATEEMGEIRWKFRIQQNYDVNHSESALEDKGPEGITRCEEREDCFAFD